MNTRALLSAASLLGAMAFGLFSIRCDKDPPTRCGMGSGTAQARYYLMSGPSDVMPGSGACAALLASEQNISLAPGTNTALPVTGEVFVTEEYLPDQSNADVTNSTPRSMAIEPIWILNRIQDSELNEGDGGYEYDSGDAGLVPGLPEAGFSSYPYNSSNPPPALPPADPGNEDRPYSWGFFDSLYPDSNGICTAHLTPSVIDLPDVPAHAINQYSNPVQSGLYPNPDNSPDPLNGTALSMLQPDQPATHVEYTWTNVKVAQTGSRSASSCGRT